MEQKYGLQLYSVRDAMAEDFEGTLKKVAEMGYTYVEFAGFFDHTAEEVKALLDKYGLIISGTHSSWEQLKKEKAELKKKKDEPIEAEFSEVAVDEILTEEEAVAVEGAE